MVGVAALGAAIVTAVAGWLAWRFGEKVGFVDAPDGLLKTHSGAPVPLGGVAVLAGLAPGLWIADALEAGWLVAAVLLVVMGLIDDASGLSPGVRLAGTAVSGAALLWGADWATGGLHAAAAVLLVMLTVNAVNLIDGLDGLAGSVGAATALGLALFAATQPVGQPWAIAILAAALLGFLIHNFAPARLYLGDNGAYLVGMTIAWGVLRASPDWSSGLVGAALIGVPFLDLAGSILRRFRARTNLFTGDREHSYDRLVRLGWSSTRVAIALTSFQLVWAAVLLALSRFVGDQAAIIAAIVTGFLIAFRLSSPRADPGSPAA